jgi:hypothetical protein
MIPLLGAQVISEIAVPAVPFTVSILLIGLAVFLPVCDTLSDRRR